MTPNRLTLQLEQVKDTHVAGKLHPDWYGPWKIDRNGKEMYFKQNQRLTEIRMLCDNAHYELTADVKHESEYTAPVKQNIDQLVNELINVCDQKVKKILVIEGSTSDCSDIEDKICPNACAAGADFDCCTKKGYQWISGQGGYPPK